MKLDKFTKVLVNLVLILLIALLVKSLVIVPRDLYAKAGVEYKTTSLVIEVKELGDEGINKLYRKTPEEEYERMDSYICDFVLNQYAKKGWRLHGYIPTKNGEDAIIIFER
jgi:deoxyhypusine synthase